MLCDNSMQFAFYITYCIQIWRLTSYRQNVSIEKIDYVSERAWKCMHYFIPSFFLSVFDLVLAYIVDNKIIMTRLLVTSVHSMLFPFCNTTHNMALYLCCMWASRASEDNICICTFQTWYFFRSFCRYMTFEILRPFPHLKYWRDIPPPPHPPRSPPMVYTIVRVFRLT